MQQVKDALPNKPLVIIAFTPGIPISTPAALISKE